MKSMHHLPLLLFYYSTLSERPVYRTERLTEQKLTRTCESVSALKSNRSDDEK